MHARPTKNAIDWIRTMKSEGYSWSLLPLPCRKELFPNMKLSDSETLAIITTDKEIKEYAKDLGWDKKQIADIKL